MRSLPICTLLRFVAFHCSSYTFRWIPVSRDFWTMLKISAILCLSTFQSSTQTLMYFPARTGRFLREKLISDHGHFSSYEGHLKRRTGKIRGAFSRMYRALDGWMLARAPASPAQGLHHHGPLYFIFPYFCTMCGLEKLGILLIKTGWNVFVRFVAENAGRG